MKKILVALSFFIGMLAVAQQPMFVPQNVKKAYTNQTRSLDGKPGPKYWQNKGVYDIEVKANPPSKLIEGKETITYTNNSPNAIKSIMVKLILNIHNPGAVRQNPVSPDYLTKGIEIDEFKENGTEQKLNAANGQTTFGIKLSTPVATGSSVELSFKWHYELSEESNREGKLDSTSSFLAYFYPRVAVLDDVHGWDRMPFTDAQEFYNDFNDYTVSVIVPKNFLVWGTGDLQNVNEVLQPKFANLFNKSLTSDEVINVVTKADLEAGNITIQNATNTWKWKATNISDMAFCISDHYVWDAASTIVDKKTGRRSSCQSAYVFGAGNFKNQVKHIQYALSWYSNNWPGIPYPFPKSCIIQGFADMEYPMMANDSPQEDDMIQRFIAQHEIGHSYFPFYMGINEHRYGYMDEGWTTAFENLIGQADLGKDKANGLFKQFRVGGWAFNPNDETQIPVITPVNILSGQAMGHNEYGKPALAYLGLKDMLGDVVFKKALHGFMDRWNSKHPIPWDMFNSFNNLTGKNLNWYWSNWFMTNNYMDIAIDKMAPTKTGYTFNVNNIGGFAIPFDVSILYADGSKEILHQSAAIWEKNQLATTININTKKKITYLVLDNGIYMDANNNDNTWGTKPEVANSSSLTNADLDKYVGNYSTKQIPIKMAITKEGTKLFAEPTGQSKIELTYKAKDTFIFEAAGVEMIFNPTTNEMTLKQGGGSFTFTKDK